MNTDQIIARIEAHCRDAGISESTFGLRAVNDGKLVDRLRSGRTITLDTLSRIEAALSGAAPHKVA
jgi:hypothetical protein